MLHRCLCPALLVSGLAAQAVQSLALPDPLDLRPTPARLQSRLQELTDEANLQASIDPVVAATIQGIVGDLQTALAGGPLPPGPGLEVHVVGFYEGAGATAVTPGTATIEVDRPGTVVVLVLNAYEPITWTLSATPGTFVLGVLAWSYEPQVLVGLPGAVQFQVAQTSNGVGDYFGAPEDATDPQARWRANKLCFEFLQLFATTFTGGYTAPSTPFVVGAANPDWLPQWVASEAVREGQIWNQATRANLDAVFSGQLFLPLLSQPSIGATGTPTIALASPTGIVAPLLPLPGVSSWSLGSAAFTLRNGAPSILDLGTLTSSVIPPDPLLPPFSFVNTLTYDFVRNRLLVSSIGGPGVLYAWDAVSATWSVLTGLANEEPAAIAHHPVYDLTYGVLIDDFATVPFELRSYDAFGTVTASLPLGLPAFGDTFGNPQLVPLGANLAYVSPAITVAGATVRVCYVIEPLTGAIVYSGMLAG